ncbi:MAG: hypothetical protein AB8F34_16370 [Akkermansiaceae bacterium]
MTPIRAFIISSSMFLTVWLAASYATQLDQNNISPTVRQSPVSTEVNASAESKTEQDSESIARLR